jgi:beta-aspartyl-peptidase (threonine type)
MQPYALALHGGAGTILPSSMTPEKFERYTSALRAALHAGTRVLQEGGSALDAVEQSVRYLEDCPLFNAGKGAVFTHSGTHEMDASIMNGANLAAGAVTGINHAKNPISLARTIMEKSDHVFLSGPQAEEFAKKMNIAFEPASYFHDDFRYQQYLEVKDLDTYQLDHTEPTEKKDKKFGTVGAVARDIYGNLAAATSTGGMTNKRWGRVGDSPIIGAGTYANNKTCAISCTGHGEFFIRAVVAYDISCLMEYKGLSLAEACQVVVHDKLVPLGGEGGLVAVDAAGNVCLPFNSEGMYRAWHAVDGSEGISIYK